METNYCPKCETQISGKFCGECGTKGVHQAVYEMVSPTPWREEKNLGLILKKPQVQNYLKKLLVETNKSLSSEEFLERVDDVLFSPITGLSMSKIAEIVVPIYRNLGIKTGKTKIATIKGSIQEVFLKTIISLVKNHYPLTEIEQAKDGVMLIAKIPSDMMTFGGSILISLLALEQEIQVSVDAKVQGQLYDWGKSKNVIKNIYTDIETLQLELD